MSIFEIFKWFFQIEIETNKSTNNMQDTILFAFKKNLYKIINYVMNILLKSMLSRTTRMK